MKAKSNAKWTSGGGHVVSAKGNTVPVIAGSSSAAVTSTLSCRVDGRSVSNPARLRLLMGSCNRLVTTYRLPSEGSIFHTSAPDEETMDSSAAWERVGCSATASHNRGLREARNHAPRTPSRVDSNNVQIQPHVIINELNREKTWR